LTGLDSKTVNLSSVSKVVSPTIATWIVLRVSPRANVSLPLVAV